MITGLIKIHFKFLIITPHFQGEKVHFYIKVSVAFCNFIFSADTD